jgi:hypothetical protein
MIVGNTFEDALMDMKYNLTPEMYKRIAISKEILSKQNEDMNLKKLAHSGEFEQIVLPSAYNMVKEGRINKGCNRTTFGLESQSFQKEYGETAERIYAYSSKDESIDILERAINSIERYASRYENIHIKDRDLAKQEQIVKRNMMTLTEEAERIRYEMSNGREEIDKQKNQSLEAWLKTIIPTECKKKKMLPIEKYGDLQKVSAIELIKPKALFMKKLLQKSLYVRKKSQSKRYLHTIIDNSGSMSDFKKHRNGVIERIYQTCKEGQISLYAQFFNTDINTDYPILSINNKNELDYVLKFQPGGDDNVGRSTYKKLESLERKKEKQYLICISDGTADLGGWNMTEEINKLAKERNVELRFIMFCNPEEINTYNISKAHFFWMPRVNR